MTWLLALGIAMAVVFAAAVIADRVSRRPLPPIGQPVRASAPPLPASRLPARIHFDLSRARQARAERGRHRRPEV
ncbi:hypothetical protein SSP24_06410 [Streptomyces spinoverrucosus]|uniref:Uncharacterized protein n=1 Tax=Streptomyces spinoverrucosus TaxID=284043 RepID=A0A4Y3VDC5_9ACTN|nr:hypothetical protein [Streptomyces spinoverrucosus]GEC02986.1 hypothetical protein SSP24_06410 [Streptomyces spinoverrucosus]GHB39070.1 hypothetical protein GCM10010397_06180 [Streptomyces spinoverrucosus]